jgi:hypothetical protein
MRAIFIADGPFVDLLKRNAARRSGVAPFRIPNSIYRRLPLQIRRALRSLDAGSNLSSSTFDRRKPPQIIDAFNNVEIYNLIVKLLNIEQFASPTNGTIGFWDRYMDDDN